MTNSVSVCLLIATLIYSAASSATKLPEKCAKGPAVWCQSLRTAVDCNAVPHCTSTVWETQDVSVEDNPVSKQFLKLLRQLKDVKSMVTESYLASRMATACHDIPYKGAPAVCRDNIAHLQKHLKFVLASNTSPETLCQVVGMCNNDKITHIIGQNKKAEDLNKPKELLGANRCTWGPTYWCSNFSTGRECRSTHHCVQRVWSKLQLPEDNDSVCLACTSMVKVARNELENNKTKEELKRDLEEFCQEIPFKEVSEMCKNLIDEYVAEMLEIIASNVNPQAVCSVAGLCNNAHVDKLLAEDKKTVDLDPPKVLLGAQHCTWGPSYWCSNFSTGRECKATHNCIQRVWSKMDLPEDNDSICKICTDMVTQARDQLLSNETQEDLKQVFEGSCQLIPIKLISGECMKLVDDFVPELVETLASEMNPQAVCSVAGLCNNARIDRLLEDYQAEVEVRKVCSGCHHVVGLMRGKFDSTGTEQFLINLLKGCRKMGSLSDSCSMLVFAHFEDIYSALKTDFSSSNVCLLSGQCAYSFHQHDEYTFANDAFIPDNALATETDKDIPCELCQQLVKHLRDVVITNTTELEFLKVLKGVCKQTGNFRDECLTLVNEYYPVIYNYLVSDLKPAEVCALAQICPSNDEDVPLAPLLPAELAVKVITPSSKVIGTDEANSYQMGRVSVPKQASVRVLGTEPPMPPPLPVERMFLNLPQSTQGCTFCQYFLHFVQVEISDGKNEEKIRDTVEHACERLPQAVSGECKQFVQAYGPAVIALLVQEIDPASVCPAIGLCPKEHEVRRVSINSESSNCPLCLFAVEQLESVLKNNRTEESIRHALDTLCNHLSQKMQTQCIDFVDTYTNSLVEMLVADMSAQEICVYLKLCTDNNKPDPLQLTAQPIDKFHQTPQLMADRNNIRKSMLPEEMLEVNVRGDIETNEIPDNTVNGKRVSISKKSSCVICEFVMKQIDDEIKDKHNEDQIKKIVHTVCSKLPKSVSSECMQFVDKYADLVISLLAQELDPNEVCQQLKLCDPSVRTKQIKDNVLDCAVCETVVMAVKKVMGNSKVDHNIVHIVEKSCNMLPAKYYDRCVTLMEIYGESVIHLIEEVGTKGVCQKIGLCSGREGTYVDMYKESRRGKH